MKPTDIDRKRKRLNQLFVALSEMNIHLFHYLIDYAKRYEISNETSHDDGSTER